MLCNLGSVFISSVSAKKKKLVYKTVTTSNFISLYEKMLENRCKHNSNKNAMGMRCNYDGNLDYLSMHEVLCKVRVIKSRIDR